MKNEQKKGMNRRQFIGKSCAAVGYTTLLSSLISMKALGAAAVDNSANDGDEYKAMVCILLAGGIDSYNILMPYDALRYGHYATSRSNLAVPQNDILQIMPSISDGGLYGVHPSMPEVQGLFNAGKLSFISNVGTLIEPINKEQFNAGSVRQPLGLFSHSDQIQHWQTGRPHERSAVGWGGRMADLIQSMNTNQDISMNVSLSGTNVFQKGQEVVEYVINQNGAVNIQHWGGHWTVNQVKRDGVESMLDQNYYDIYKDTYKNTVVAGKNASVQFQAALDASAGLNTEFPEDYFAQNLKMVARSIQIGQELGFKRQTYFVTFGGWDHHDAMIQQQADMFPVLSGGLSALNTALEEINLSNNVTTFTISDFARTLTSNGDGTDHAWGGNAMVMGGAVDGGKIFGAFPNLELNNPLELGNGRLLPTTSADEYLAEIARWFGVSGSDLNMIFPNLSNFYDTASGSGPLGFLM